jgi:hypothetical protein
MSLMQKETYAVKRHCLSLKIEPIFAGNTWRYPLLPFALLVIFLSGCATPVGTRAVGVRQTYEQINRNAIKEDAYSDASALVLRRFSLEEKFTEDPDATIEILHDKASEDDRRDLLYALSELTYLIAEKARLKANKAGSGTGPAYVQRAKRFYLASAVYAYERRAVETGDAIIRAATGKRLDDLDLDDADRAIVERYLVFSPLPYVSRVVFIATPHRGNYLAGGWIRRVVQKIVSLPGDVVKQATSLVLAANKMGAAGFEETESLPTSIDGMSPSNPGLLALAEIPLAPGITGHSIIAIDGDENPPDGEDGVVKYTSAHVDYVESEFVVRSGHSCQEHPLVIEEVRRILLAHLDGLDRLQ